MRRLGALALILVVAVGLGLGCAAVEAKLCGVHPTYGRVCAYWSGGKLVIEAEVSIPESASGEVLEWLKGQ